MTTEKNSPPLSLIGQIVAHSDQSRNRTELAEAAGMSKQMLNQTVKRNAASLKTLERLARAAGGEIVFVPHDDSSESNG